MEKILVVKKVGIIAMIGRALFFVVKYPLLFVLDTIVVVATIVEKVAPDGDGDGDDMYDEYPAGHARQGGIDRDPGVDTRPDFSYSYRYPAAPVDSSGQIL